jgi:hypothetical protein
MIPSSVAVRSLSAPQNLPKGVRAAERMTISFSNSDIIVFYRNTAGERYKLNETRDQSLLLASVATKGRKE